MKDPIKWFEEAGDSEKYNKEVIAEIKACISEEGFNIDEFMEWVSKQLEKEIKED